MNTPMLINANSLHIPLASESVQMVATSPPYYSLRIYETGANKAHEIGSENTVKQYVENLVLVFRELWRVLRSDGVVWLNLGDSYNGSGGAGGDYAHGGLKDGKPKYKGARVNGLKPKDLIGIPWRVAFALQDDGWYLRSDVIWSKPNPMPESVTDRPTKAHEYIFLLTKSQKYFYDAEAIKEPITESTIERGKYGWNGKTGSAIDASTLGARVGNAWQDMANSGMTLGETGLCPASGVRNKRSVWEVATTPYNGAHFATWPPALVEPMIKAGTSERGCCPHCGAPWGRNPEYIREGKPKLETESWNSGTGLRPHKGYRGNKTLITQDWQPTCTCPPHDPIPCLVLDPFAGSGTTLMVARQLGRRAVGLDLSYTYLSQCARPRLSLDALENWQNGIPVSANGYHELPLFQSL